MAPSSKYLRHHLTPIEVDIIEKMTSMTVIVTIIGLKEAGADTARARETAPRIPQTDMNMVSLRSHFTPPIRTTPLKKNTLIIRPVSYTHLTLPTKA